VLISFKSSNPSEFIQKNGYRAILVGDAGEEKLSLAMLDGSNEKLMDVLLNAIMDLQAEGKVVSDIRYKGKGVRRWFQMVYPAVLQPTFFGVFTTGGAMVGYLVAFQSSLSPSRKVIGIALLESARGRGIGSRVFKHVQENLETMFRPGVTELNFETSVDNAPMIQIARKLGFVEFFLPDEEQWKDSRQGRIRFSWCKL
jgi:GNAT superfamily N-acetyltransferase